MAFELEYAGLRSWIISNGGSFVALRPILLICSTLCDPRVEQAGGILLMVDKEGGTFSPVVENPSKSTGATGSQFEKI